MEIDRESLQASIEGYIGRSQEIQDSSYLDIQEQELIDLRNSKGFSFPTNEGMRKITKHPEMDKTENDPVLKKLTSNIRQTIRGVSSNKQGGLYAGVNAFHHGHLAYLSKSESVVSIDMNKLVPYGFAFIVGLVGGSPSASKFKEEMGLMAANPNKFKEFFYNTDLEDTVLLQSDNPQIAAIRQRMVGGFIETMNEFDPRVHGQDKVPPVFCNDEEAYNYFRSIILKNSVAGVATKLEGKSLTQILAKSITSLNPSLPEVNTLYVSSCFDPRFAGPQSRKEFLSQIKKEGHKDVQLIESFLNSGWIVYEVN